jgi:hypothetical protein
VLPGSPLLFSVRSTAALDSYFDLDLKTQLAVDKMSQQIRRVQKLTACPTTNLTSTNASCPPPQGRWALGLRAGAIIDPAGIELRFEGALRAGRLGGP